MKIIGWIGLAAYTLCCASPEAPRPANASRIVNHLSETDRVTLEACFLTALRHSQLAAVLYGDKPVCIDGAAAVPHIPNLMRDSNLAVYGDLYLEGLRIWEELALCGSQYTFVRGASHSVSNPQACLCLWVNHKAFLDVVAEHLNLFRMMLGANVTPEGLLAKIIAPGVRFRELLGEDDVLIGLVLGYGLENAMLHAQRMRLMRLACSRETVPLRRRADRYPQVGELADLVNPCPLYQFLTDSDESRLVSQLDPGTAMVRYQEIDNTMKLSIHLSAVEQHQIPFFGCKPDSQETMDLVAGYVRAAQRAEQVVDSDNCLELIVERLCS